MPKKEYYKDLKFMFAFGKHLREIRESKGITQEVLAIECEFEISQISRIERGKINPSISTVNKIAKHLGVHTKELFDFDF